MHERKNYIELLVIYKHILLTFNLHQKM